MTMNTAAMTDARTNRLEEWPGLCQALQTPPQRASGWAELLETVTRTPRCDLPAGIEGDVSSGWFRSTSNTPLRQVSSEILRLAPGAWLVAAESYFSAPQYIWTRERQLREFCVVLRGGGVFGFARSPHRRFALTEGQSIGVAYGGDTLICRTPLPGVRDQWVSVFFDCDEAMRQFGLDVNEANSWLSSVNTSHTAAPGLRLVISTPNIAVSKAARAIFCAPYDGARRRLFLRSKAGEMLCHLLASPRQSACEMDSADSNSCDDETLAALAREAVSDSEHCADVEDVAARLHVSTGRLLAAFRATYGISLRDHMNTTRMALARHLLTQTNTPLVEVAAACRYEHHSSFSTAYRRNFGETPFETRRVSRLSNGHV
jgi:AraC-like DNA-binding protein